MQINLPIEDTLQQLQTSKLLDEVFAAFTAPTEITPPSVKDPKRA